MPDEPVPQSDLGNRVAPRIVAPKGEHVRENQGLAIAAPEAHGVRAMQVIHERCAGIDVHKATAVACASTPVGKELTSSDTKMVHLKHLAEWLQAREIKIVAMESTGSYWKPIYNVLEAAGIEIILVNARDFRNLPGRKTDMKDAEWLADLLRHGLVRGSYIPNRSQRELKELVRYRRSLVDEASREQNRIQKVLEGANIKLGDVATDVMGKSGREILKAMIDGELDPKTLAAKAHGKLKKKRDQLEEALNGTFGVHQKMMLEAQFRHVEFLEAEIAKLDEEIEERMRPFEEALTRADEVDGIGPINAQEIIAEIGVDMTRFPTAAHLASWSGVCPGNNESAGKRKSGKTRKGNSHARSALVRAARAAARTKNTYLSALYHRLAARRGDKRAVVAVAHAIIVALYHMLRDNTTYRDLGAEYFDRLNEENVVKRSVERLAALGYQVTLTKPAPAA